MENANVRAKTCQEIVNAAVQIMTTGGLAAVTRERIAEITGKTARTVHRYFPKKVDLLAEIVLSQLRIPYKNICEFTSTPEFLQLNGRAQLMAILHHRVDFCCKNMGVVVCLNEIELYAVKNGFGQLIFERCQREFNGCNVVVQRAFDKGIADGSINPGIKRDLFLDVINIGVKGWAARTSLIFHNNNISGGKKRKNSPQSVIEPLLRLVEIMLTLDFERAYEKIKSTTTH